MAAESAIAVAPELDEKAFYLDEFHEKTLVIGVVSTDCGGSLEALRNALAELAAGEARVVVIAGDPAVCRAAAPRGGIIEAGAERMSVELALDVWRRLRLGPVAALHDPAPTPYALAHRAVELAEGLRVHKLVIADAAGGIGVDGISSFLDASDLEALLADPELPVARARILQRIREGLQAGVPSINLCRVGEVDRELFTYEGAGTLFTLEDYCRVERLGIDDFHEVERLIQRGQREGFLKPRSEDEIAELLLTGYGATIGTGHLAGVGSVLVEDYREQRVGEVVGLYTIGRFQGEGVADRILERIVADAYTQGLKGLFACTTERRAVSFFRRNGFEAAQPGQVPESKWEHYEDADRRQRLSALFRALP